MLVSGSDFYCGNSSGAPCQFALKSQVPSQYVHPTSKQCNYTYTHPSTKQCNYSVDLSGYAKSSDLNSLKTSVSSGKQLVASAVTGKGVQTAANASFQTIANNINAIPGAKTSASISSCGNWHGSNGSSPSLYSFDGTTIRISLCGAFTNGGYMYITLN